MDSDESMIVLATMPLNAETPLEAVPELQDLIVDDSQIETDAYKSLVKTPDLSQISFRSCHFQNGAFENLILNTPQLYGAHIESCTGLPNNAEEILKSAKKLESYSVLGCNIPDLDFYGCGGNTAQADDNTPETNR